MSPTAEELHRAKFAILLAESAAANAERALTTARVEVSLARLRLEHLQAQALPPVFVPQPQPQSLALL
jgi:hypothetical protein